MSEIKLKPCRTAEVRWEEGINLLFCKHKYTVLSMPKVYTVYADGSRSNSPTEFLVVQHCEKCGKIKQTKVKT